MPSAYETGLLITYLQNIQARLNWSDPEADRYVAWLRANEGMLSQARQANALARWLRPKADLHPSRKGCFQGHDDAADRWAQLGEAIGHLRHATQDVATDAGATRLNWIGGQLGLSRIDVAVVEALARYTAHPVIGGLVDAVFTPRGRRYPFALPERALACLVGTTPKVLRGRLPPYMPLARFGLVVIDDHSGVGVGDHVRRLGLVSHRKGDSPSWLGTLPEGPFDWTEFEYLGQDHLNVEALFDNAVECGRRGVNILVHGPFDSGKVGFCMALSERAAIDLYSISPTSVAESDRPCDQVLTLLAAQSWVWKNGRAVLLADGMDGLLTGGLSAWQLNRLLKYNPVPTFWTVPDAGRIAPRVLEQMAFTVPMPPHAGSWECSSLWSLQAIEARAWIPDCGTPGCW